MFALQALLTTVVVYLALRVQATPLSHRDVIAPHITSPNADTVWPVGTVQTVTWDTSDFPPDSQITNPIGQVILGTNSSGTFHFNFSQPLAKGFMLRDGSVKLTVPDVPPSDDYLIVLFGDSGNTSPTFAITRISSSAPVVGGSSSTLITTPIPITGSVITGSVTTDAGSTTSSSATPTDSGSSSPTPTSPSSSTSSSSSSSASPSPTQTSAAWSVHQASGPILSFNALAVCMASMIMLIVV